MAQGKPRTVDHQFYINASPEKVFRAFTEPRQLVRWLSEEAEVERRKGGAYRLIFAGGWLHEGSVVGYSPGRSITLAWSWPGVPVTGTRLKMSVKPKGSGTIFRMVHTGFPPAKEWVDLYGGAEWGWTYYGLNLKSVLESGHDLRSAEDR